MYRAWDIKRNSWLFDYITDKIAFIYDTKQNKKEKHSYLKSLIGKLKDMSIKIGMLAV